MLIYIYIHYTFRKHPSGGSKLVCTHIEYYFQREQRLKEKEHLCSCCVGGCVSVRILCDSICSNSWCFGRCPFLFSVTDELIQYLEHQRLQCGSVFPDHSHAWPSLEPAGPEIHGTPLISFSSFTLPQQWYDKLKTMQRNKEKKMAGRGEEKEAVQRNVSNE